MPPAPAALPAGVVVPESARIEVFRPGTRLSASALAGIVVLGAMCASPSVPGSFSGGQGNWVVLEPGARPAYVGIQGGTARVSLLRSPNGTLMTFTGNTGNDFIQVLRGKNSSEAAETPAGNVQALPSSSVPPSVNASTPAAPAASDKPLEEEPLFSGSPHPFGLSNPEGVVTIVPEKTLEQPPAEEKPKPAARKKKKLKLRSYMKVLSPGEAL